jgi:hypothetical protein
MTKTILDSLGAFAWPVAVAWIAWLYRSNVKSLIEAISGLAGRIKKIGPADFQDAPEKVAANTDIAGGQALPIEPLRADPTLTRWLDHIHKVIEENKLAATPDFQDRLIHALAWNARHNDFRRIGDGLFGSQLLALHEMKNSGPLSQKAIKAIYASHKERASEINEKPLTFAAWWSYLRNNWLVEMTSDGMYAVTDIGVVFLDYAANAGLTEDKPF